MLGLLEIKTFVPAKDFDRSRQFYTTLGFAENWANPQLAEFEFAGSRFLLQNFYEPKLAENLMMQMMVPDVEEWWSFVQQSELLNTFAEARVKAPEVQSWGQKVMFLWEPSGVLWHIAEAQTETQTKSP